MSTSSNKQIVQAFMEMFNKRDCDGFRDYISENFEYALETWIDRGFSLKTEDKKAVIADVPAKSPCAGQLQPGDEIIFVQEAENIYDTFEKIRYFAWGFNPKQTVHLRARRGEEIIECNITPYVEKGGTWARTWDDWEKSIQDFEENYPEYHFSIEYLVAENDLVACVGSVSGTDKKFNNRPFAYSQALVFQLADGKITSCFEVHNTATELRQQGYRILPIEN